MSKHSDIQKDFSFLLDGYPLLKKFGSSQHTGNFIELLNLFLQLDRLLFKIEFRTGEAGGKVGGVEEIASGGGGGVEEIASGGGGGGGGGAKSVYICPCFESTSEKSLNIKHIYTANKLTIERYIRHQLVQSGILTALADIPQRNVCIRLIPQGFTNPTPAYHNDSTLFQILQYNNYVANYNPASTVSITITPSPYVLSSELLMYHNMEDNSIIHTLLVKERNDTGALERVYFNPEVTGQVLHDRYETIKRIYSQIKDEVTILRFKVKPCDTVVFPDTLWKHAAINKRERKGVTTNQLVIAMATGEGQERGEYVKNMSICNKRVQITPADTEHRQLILLSCFLNNRDMDPEGFSPELEFKIQDLPGVSPEAMPVPEIDFTEEQCVNFFKGLHQVSHAEDVCMLLGEVNIFNRGGNANRFKRRYPNKKRRTYKKQRTNKKRRTNKRRNPTKIRPRRK